MGAISRRLLLSGVLAGGAALAACDITKLVPRLSPEQEAASRAAFDAMQKGDLSGIALGPEMQTPEAQAALPQVFAAIPKGSPTSVTLTGWKIDWNETNGVKTERFHATHDYVFPDGTYVVQTFMSRETRGGQPGPWTLHGFDIAPKAAEPTPPGKTKA